MQKIYKITINDLTIEVIQDNDGKFIKPSIIDDYNSFGTALKPAYEPIIVARKPMRTTVAENVIKNGVGGINIDECRIPFEDTPNPATNPLYRQQNKDKYKQIEKGQESNGAVNFTSSKNDISKLGRFPANIIHDGSDEVCEGFPSSNKQNGSITKPYKINNQVYGDYGNCNTFEAYQDSGSASRYFYTAKASKKDRDEGLSAFDEVEIRGGGGRVEDGYNEDDDEEQRLKESARKYGAVKTKKRNIHPTVKPCELMQYLVRLVSPKGATILDPFMGSGSTGKAVMFENRERNANYKFIGIDLDEKYCQLSSSRIDYALNKYEYDFNQELQVAKKQGQLNIFDIME